MRVFDRYMFASAIFIGRAPFARVFDEVQVTSILTEHFLPEFGKYFSVFVITLSFCFV